MKTTVRQLKQLVKASLVEVSGPQDGVAQTMRIIERWFDDRGHHVTATGLGPSHTLEDFDPAELYNRSRNVASMQDFLQMMDVDPDAAQDLAHRIYDQFARG